MPSGNSGLPFFPGLDIFDVKRKKKLLTAMIMAKSLGNQKVV